MIKIKVCGMRQVNNIQQLMQLPINYIGFIFYPPSKRCIKNLDKSVLLSIPASIKKVGVFVNPDLKTIINKIENFNLDVLQLHGEEKPDFIEEIKQLYPNIEIIKSFLIDNKKDFDQISDYKEIVNYLLFDTKTSQYGGSGKRFNWKILETYQEDIPFFLSGGIGLEHIKELKKMKHPQLFAFDINSKFEITPALKAVDKVEKFISIFEIDL